MKVQVLLLLLQKHNNNSIVTSLSSISRIMGGKYMFKVMIVDDEAIFREYLRTQIDWESHGYALCGEAIDGIDALKMAKLRKPDIAIIDIDMPNMDGLTLAHELKEKYDDIGIIMVTGYDEFEYAIKAIKIGVEDYIVKPYIKSELLSALLGTSEKLQIKRVKNEERKHNFYEIRERALNMLLGGGYQLSDEEVCKQLERLDIRLVSNLFIVTTMEINNLYQRWNDANDIVDDISTVLNIVNNMFKEKYSHISFRGPENRIISIVTFKDECEMEHFNTDVYKIISGFLFNNFDIIVTVGIGTMAEGFVNIRKSYLNSLYAIRNKSNKVAGEVLLYSEAKFRLNNTYFYSNNINEKLTMYLRLNDFPQIQEELDNIFNYSINKKQTSDYNNAIIKGLIDVCLSYITEMNENIDNVLGTDFYPNQIIEDKISMEEVKESINELFRRIVDHFTNIKPTRARKIAEMVKNYIDEHYNDNELSLEKISKHFFLNYDYVRRAFKKELNHTLTDYITSVRMEKVKELMGNGNIKLSSLCYDVGIRDASYLSKCFKKYYGLSPREYENVTK